MHGDDIHPAWLEAFERVFALCAIAPAERVALLCETGSRALNVTLAKAALKRMGVEFTPVIVPTPPPAPRPDHPLHRRLNGAGWRAASRRAAV